MDCVGWWEGLKLGCIGAGFGRPLSQPVVRHVGLRFFFFFFVIFIYGYYYYLYIYIYIYFFSVILFGQGDYKMLRVCWRVSRGFCLGGSGLSGLLVS